jgi:hypothetical protein
MYPLASLSRIAMRSIRVHIQNQKGGPKARHFSKNSPGVGSPGGAEHSTRAEIHFFFDFLAFFAFAFFAFFAFLAIVSSQGFNGLNATPRHAWRRASLATSSIAIPPDSERAAACRHGAVITLSTAVMRFRVIFDRNAVHPHAPNARASCLTLPEHPHPSSNQNHDAHYIALVRNR